MAKRVTVNDLPVPTRDEIQHLLASIAQVAINIREGHTTIEDGSRLFRAFESLCEPRVANLLLAAPGLLTALRQAEVSLANSVRAGEGGLARRHSLEAARAAIKAATGEEK